MWDPKYLGLLRADSSKLSIVTWNKPVDSLPTKVKVKSIFKGFDYQQQQKNAAHLQETTKNSQQFAGNKEK